MHNLFELTETKKWATWMITISVLLFISAAVLHFFHLLDEGLYQIMIGSHWYSLQSILIFATFILGMILILLGISLHMLCNNISRLMKSYDDEMYKKMKM